MARLLRGGAVPLPLAAGPQPRCLGLALRPWRSEEVADMVTGTSRQPPRPRGLGALLGLCSLALLPGCTVVAVTATAVSVTATAVGLAADVAVGTAKVVGHGVGAAVDALSEDGASAQTPAAAPAGTVPPVAPTSPIEN